MSARTPEDLGRLFTAALNAGDVDAVLQLYEPQSVLRPSPGQMVQGTAAIHAALLGFAASAVKAPAVRDKLSAQGIDVTGASPEQLDAFVRKEIPRWAQVIKENNIKTGD